MLSQKLYFSTLFLKCETNINDCYPNPCGTYQHPRGECIDEIAGFTCNCNAGFTGETCGLDVEECSSSPCGPYGTCNENIVNQYECSCPKGADSGVFGYSKYVFCNKDLNECASNPCTHGTCSESVIVQGDNQCGEGFVQIQCESQDKCVKLLYENNRVTFYRSKQVYYYNEAREFCKSLAKDANLARMKSEQEFSSVVDQFINNSDEWKLEPVWDSVNYPGKSPSLNAWYHGIGVIQSVRSENGRGDTFLYEDDTDILFYDFETSFNFARSSTKHVSIWHDGVILSTSTFNHFTYAICEIPIGSVELSKPELYSCTGLNKKLDFYRCVCDNGYTGERCNLDIDECASFPCNNGATCQNAAGSSVFVCVCSIGWNGEFCDDDIDECLSYPCGENGYCDTSNGAPNPSIPHGTFACTCKPGWTGVFCTEDINECESDPCGENGFCVNGKDEYSCECAPGFIGQHCETDVQECDSSPCEPFGTCNEPRSGSYRCSCPTGAQSSDFSISITLQCDQDIDECQSNPCGQHGACENSLDALNLNFFECTCLTGFTGLTCELEIDECLGNPCGDNGVCFDEEGQFKCQCKKGFTGETCDTDISECDSNPCVPFGTCNENKPGEYECDCPAGVSQSTYKVVSKLFHIL